MRGDRMTTRTIREKPVEVTATEFRGDVARVLRDAHYGIPTLITNNGEPFAKVVHPDAGVSLDPGRVDHALRAVIARLDYDLHKELERDEEEGDDTYRETVAAFITAYEETRDDC